MQRLEVSGAVRPIYGSLGVQPTYGSLGVKRLTAEVNTIFRPQNT